jgi:outer membrane protein assembly factor BamB
MKSPTSAFVPFVSSWFKKTVFILIATSAAYSARAENWDRFRGPNGAGQSDAQGIPTEWNAENILWKKSLPGVGHSSPVIWGDRLFVTTADPETGEQVVIAFDAKSGQQQWERRFAGSKYHIHDFNSYASSSPTVDENHVYVMWLAAGRVLVAALTHDGNEVWRKEAGSFEEIHGFGKSPVVVDDLVYVVTDNEGESEITAFDCLSGDVRWQRSRAPGITAFATPCLLNVKAVHKQLLTLSNGSGLLAVDAATGDPLWQGFREELSQRCVASPIVAEGMVFVLCGQGGNGKLLIAARPGDENNPPQEVYRLTQSVPQVPTPVVAGNLLFVWHDRGVVSCYDLATGRQHWKQRVGGDFHGSPIRIGDRIFCPSRSGEMVVLSASPTYQLLARNDLGEACQSTPAVAHNRLYVHTESSLLCIGDPADNK